MAAFLKGSWLVFVSLVDAVIGVSLGVILFPIARMLRSPVFYVVMLALVPGVISSVLLWGAMAVATLVAKLGLVALVASPIVSLLAGMAPFFLVSLAANFVAQFITFVASSAFDGIKVGFFDGVVGVFSGLADITLGKNSSDDKKHDEASKSDNKDVVNESTKMMTNDLDKAKANLTSESAKVKLDASQSDHKEKKYQSIYPDLKTAANDTKENEQTRQSSLYDASFSDNVFGSVRPDY